MYEGKAKPKKKKKTRENPRLRTEMLEAAASQHAKRVVVVSLVSLVSLRLLRCCCCCWCFFAICQLTKRLTLLFESRVSANQTKQHFAI